ncbi:AraC family transcriptional regulator [Marinobacter sp. DUT-3]|uniref:AraC family transcriptional regulator n=1 Tax=Marinobacter sp. DUT-3 TaxID=3412036 RepID=UPI003D179927
MSNFEHTLHPVAISQVMINFAASQGVDRDTCLLGTGISDQDLLDGEALITRDQEMRLIENLILALPETPALGFQLGLQYSLATFGIWGFAMRTSRTLREAIARAMRYLPLSTAYCRISRIDEGNCFGVAMDAQPIPHHLRPFLLERDLATGLNLLKELSLSSVDIVALEFQGAPPEHAQRIGQLCGITPTYHSARNAIVVHSDVADQPLSTYDSHLVRMLDDQCRRRLERLQTSGLAGQVRQKLHGPLGLVASLDEIAQALALSPRSLRRKLDQEGTSFRTLVEDERRQIALQFLDGSDMKLEELAIHLGYTDTASFTRAFRRWMGCSPGEYRQTQRLDRL